MKNNLLISTIICIFFISCDSNSSSTGNNIASSENQTIITSSIYEGNYYFDLINNISTDSSSIWQISFQNKSISYECTQEDVDTESLCSNVGQELNFLMPSLVLGDVLASVYDDLEYNQLENYPDSFMQDASSFDNLSIEYGGDNVIIMYNMSNHQVSLSESVLLVYNMVNHSIFKLKFNEYSSGIISFDFQQL